MSVPAFVPDELRRLGLEAAVETLPRQAQFLDRLLETNQQFNLTAIRDRDTAWRRHIIDSLTLLPFVEDMPAGASLVDVGSGGGMPGVPVAIARVDLRLTLLEATGKKARFLATTISALQIPNSRVVNERAETVGQDPAHRQQYDAACCRAIGPMSQLLEYCMPLIRVGGRLLAMKGPKAESELGDAVRAAESLGAGELGVYDSYVDGFDRESVIIVIEKSRPTPRNYPRKPGVPRQSPL